MSSKEKKERHRRHMRLHLWCLVAVGLFVAMLALYAFPMKLSRMANIRKIIEIKKKRTLLSSVNSTVALVDELGLKQRPAFLPITKREKEEKQQELQATEQKRLAEIKKTWTHCKSCSKKTGSYTFPRSGHGTICEECDKCKRCKTYVGDHKHNHKDRRKYRYAKR